MSTTAVLLPDGTTTKNIQDPLAPGQATRANSKPVTLASEDIALFGSLNDGIQSDPAAASAGMLGLLRGILDQSQKTGVLDANNIGGVTAVMSDTSAHQVINALTGAKIVVETVVVSNTSATPTAVELLDGATVIGVFPAAANCGGAAVSFYRVGSTNTVLNARCQTNAAAVVVTVAGHKA